MNLLLRQETVTVCDFLQAGNIAPGLLLNVVNADAGFQQIVCRSGIQPDQIILQRDDVQLALLEVSKIDIRDFQLSACGRLDVFCDFRDLRIIKVQTGNDIIGLGEARLLLDADCSAVFVELNHTERTGVVHIIAEHNCAVLLRSGSGEFFVQCRGIENVVTEHQTALLSGNEVLCNQQRVRDAARNLLHGIADGNAKGAAVTQQLFKGFLLVRRDDNHNIVHAGLHQNCKRIIDQRLVVNRKQRLAYRERHWIQARAFARCKNNSLHILFTSSLHRNTVNISNKIIRESDIYVNILRKYPG